MSNVQRGGRLGRGSFAVRAGLIALLALGMAAVQAGNLPRAAAAPQLSISTAPALTPAFNPSVVDYTARCGKSLTASTTVTVSVHAPAGTSVSVAGVAPKSGTFRIDIKRAWDQSFAFVVRNGGAAPVTHYVRCMPTDMPSLTALRSGTPGNDYFLLSGYRPVVASGGGPFSTHYVEIVDTHGVPVWWHDARFGVADTKVLANGNIAWMSKENRGITRMGYSGSPRATLQIPENSPADTHDFEQLPNGNWLMETYTRVSGVDLTSIGGPSSTCILDAEIEEVTPSGQRVWSWFARQHLSPTELNPTGQPRVAHSTCAAPVDAWHLNSLEPLGGDLLISLRFTNAIFRIDRATGNVVWKLGGSTTPQSLTIVGDPLSGFIGQHDARMWPDGSVSVFDNGADGVGAFDHKARMVRYQINTVAGTATMVQQIQEPLTTGPATCCGSARWLPNGNWAIGYGQLGVNTEVTPSGTRVLSLNFNDPSTNPAAPAPTLFSYRMTPIPPGTLSVSQLRAGMDAMHTAAPAISSAVPSGDGSAKVIWAASARNATTAVTGYVVTPYLGTVAQRARTFNPAARSGVITGLRNGAAYQFAVTATTALGSSARSNKSAKIIVGTPGRPGTPTATKSANAALKVTFTGPFANGAKITRFIVACTSNNGGVAKAQAGSTHAIIVKGLTAGKTYTCTVKAKNDRGIGPTSHPSKAAKA